MSHGSSWKVAASAVIAELAADLTGWAVQYSGPKVGTDLRNDAGEYKSVHVLEEGSSSFEPFSLGVSTGYRETCTFSLVFQRMVEEADVAQADVDDDVATATGALVDLLAADPKLGGDVRADGWALGWVTVSGMSREGGILPSRNGRGCRVTVELEAQSMRCW